MNSEGPAEDRLTEREKRSLHPHRNIYKAVLILILFFLVSALMRITIADHMEDAGTWLVEEFGYPGIFVTVLIMDTFILPVTPDLVIFVSIAGEMDPFLAVASMSAASILGGNIGYFIGMFLGRREFVRRILGRNMIKGHYLSEKYGMGAVVLGALTPIPFSTVCWTAGLLRMDHRKFMAATTYRLPRFLLWYLIIGVGFKGLIG